jgi:hypothetical protein
MRALPSPWQLSAHNSRTTTTSTTTTTTTTVTSTTKTIITQTDPQLHPKLILLIVRYSTSNFNLQHTSVYLRSSTSSFHCQRISVPSIGPSIKFCRRHSLIKIRPIHLVVLSFILCKIFRSSLTHCNATLESMNRFSLNMIYGRSYYKESQHTFWTNTNVKSWKYNTGNVRIK